MTLVIVHVVLGILLFVVINWIGAHSRALGYQPLTLSEKVIEAPAFNAIYRIMAPQVFIIIAAACFTAINLHVIVDSIWHVTLIYFIVRWMYILLMGRRLLISWWTQLVFAAVSTSISYWLSTRILSNPSLALPESTNFTSELWIIVLIFIYQTFNGLSIPGDGLEKRQDRYIECRFIEFRERFDDVISKSVTDTMVVPLVYSVMIYENFNRPAFARMIENRLLFPLGLAKTLGPMQVSTTVRLSDEEIVKRGVVILDTAYREASEKHKEWSSDSSWCSHFAYQAAMQYNPDSAYAQEVRNIFDKLVSKHYPVPNFGVK